MGNLCKDCGKKEEVLRDGRCDECNKAAYTIPSRASKNYSMMAKYELRKIKMCYIKEYHASGRALVRTIYYDKTLGHILKLFKEAKKSVPELKEDDVKIVIYGGRFYSGTMGIEFAVTEKPHGFEETKQLEMIR